MIALTLIQQEITSSDTVNGCGVYALSEMMEICTHLSWGQESLCQYSEWLPTQLLSENYRIQAV